MNGKIFELKSLVYNDDNKFRTFRSTDFNFILDKEKEFSICYASDMNEIPTYDPLSPEEVEIILNESFNFEKERKNIDVLFNINEEKDNSLISISTISIVNINVKNLYMENFDEIVKLSKYLNSFNFSINIKISADLISELRDVIRLKLFENVSLLIDSYEIKIEKILNQLKLLLSKNIDLSYNFYITKNNIEEFKNLIKSDFPKNTFSNIIFDKTVTKKLKNEVIELINDFNFIICDTENVKNNNVKYHSIKKYQNGLFKCYIDFVNRNVNCKEDIKVSFNKIKRINSYWNSSEFMNYRLSLIDSKIEQNEK